MTNSALVRPDDGWTAKRTDDPTTTAKPCHINSLTPEQRRLVFALLTMRDERAARLAAESKVAA